MFDEILIIFAIIGFVGLGIIVLGFKFSDKTRKVVETTGAIIFHVGVFGILYHKVSLNLFLSLVTLVVSLFILIDPLKIALHVNAKIYRLIGYLALFTAVAFSLDYFSGFPVWLWGIPLIIYLAPYLIRPLKKYLKLVLAIAWLVVLSYVGLIGYVIYTKYSPQSRPELVQKYFPQLKFSSTQTKDPIDNQELFKNDDLQAKKPVADDKSQVADQPIDKPKDKTEDTQVKTTIAPPPKKVDPIVNKPAPKIEGPYLKSLQKADEKYIQLQTKYDNLKKRFDDLKQTNQELKKELEILRTKKTESF